MATIASHEGGYLINDTILVWVTTPDLSKITLNTIKWDNMRYGDAESTHIDFPGEYGLWDVVVRTREAGDALHHIVRFGTTESVAVLMNPKSVDHDALKSATLYLCADSDTKDRLEQNEFEWEIMTFDEAIA